ncbi:MAG: hypothetical protein HC878_03535 [Leptolyngbyaceae cyanobacterium SL_5_14]|nr:hypothetical protein [Leptolyngbyaceae cyanobacterium SL_5_14]NJO66165.1 hypothetical protein [Leptolyngbyaceae cyanobacterium RM1_405_57]
MSYPPEVMEVLGHHAAMVYVAAKKIADQQRRSYAEVVLELVSEGQNAYEQMSPKQLQAVTDDLLEALSKVKGR